MKQEKTESKVSLFKKIEPIASVILVALGLLATTVPDWIRYIAVIVAVLLVISWLFSELGWMGQAIKFRLFQSGLSKEHATRLSVLLDSIDNMMSDAYTLSPFYIWRNCNNKYPKTLRMNHGYLTCIRTWLRDIQEKIDDPAVKNPLIIESLSKAISETTRLAESVEQEINELIRVEEIDEQEKQNLLKDWDASKNYFNQWIDRWENLFKEINKSKGMKCMEYFRVLKMIG